MNSIFKPYKILLLLSFVGGISVLSSCLDDDNDTYYIAYPNALVTAKTSSDDVFFLQLDDSTTLLPVNMATSPFGGKEVRALMNYEETREASGNYDRAIRINWIDSILTKPMAIDLGEDNDKVYGTDPIEIVPDWMNIAEDGYLTLRFSFATNNAGVTHYINLLSTNNPDDPYEVEFRHNAHGDIYGRESSGIVAFKLTELPDTGGKTVRLTLKWKSLSGERSAQFNYKG